jgi:hypothetical protein
VKLSKSGTIVWQGNVGAGKEPPADHGVRVAETPQGFLLQGRSSGSVRGWVIAPAGAKIVAADPVQVTVAGDEAEIMVVLWIGTGAPPDAQVADGAVNVAGTKVRFDAKGDRLLFE